MRNGELGLLLGLALGFAAVFGGWNAFIVVFGCAAAGLFLGRLLDGMYDVRAVAGILIGALRRAHAQAALIARGRGPGLPRDPAGSAFTSRLREWRSHLPGTAPGTAPSARFGPHMSRRTAPWSARRQPGTRDQTAVLDLLDLTDETMEIRHRGVARLTKGTRLRINRSR
jgi:hypothetical protein